MRLFLDRLYAGAFALGAGCLGLIALLVLAQIAGRLIDRVLIWAGLPVLGLAIPSIAEIGAFLFVSAVFLAMAGTLRTGGHVRVTLAAQRLPEGAARGLGVAVIAVALALGLWATWNAIGMVRDSLRFGDVSYGMIPIPLAVPQGVMAAGLALFCVALVDEGWAVLRGRTPAYRAAEAASEVAGDAGERGD